MRTAQTLALAAVLLATTGCFRTVYHHLEPPSYQPATQAPRVAREDSGWQHFFIYGWAPGEKVIDAAGQCGGVESVKEIRTQRSFAQGLIAAIAGYYINIYSPYNGQVICAGNLRR